ncbi:SWI/SNF2 family helicase [Lymphocystis disease virus 1]|uniref:SWI/SNF2 family helicase n=1 Tax=Fish lymphocystis disease virus TaxID=36363 RepID=UPI0000161EA1|nr:SWI/SNF2 family helicase [Lymphocystis disease virus 1]
MIHYFLPKYPYINVVADNINPYPDINFETALSSKLELKTTIDHDNPFTHQLFLERIFSDGTPYTECLIFHAMGTGKTCSVIKIAEQAKLEARLKGVLILARGTTLLKNFLYELLFKCTDGQYIPDNYLTLTALEKTYRIKKLTETFYHFKTFETFAKQVNKWTDNQLRTRYNNYLIVIDEVHHIKTGDDKDVNYGALLRFMRTIKNCKKILLSGTPMANSPIEILDVMNLILPKDKAFTAEDGIFDSKGRLQNKDRFIEKIRGRVSYLKATNPGTGLKFIGEPIGGLKYFSVVHLPMSSFQSNVYELAHQKDVRERNIFINSRQASLAIYPNGMYGAEGYKMYIHKKNKYFINEMLDNLSKYSCKYQYVLNILKKSEKVFIYCEYINGSGLYLLTLLLDKLGWVRATGNEQTPRPKRYALLTAEQKNIQLIIQRFNKLDNIDGAFINVILGSRVISEGITLKNVRDLIILTPHWNYTETSQAIARGWRANSHQDIINRGETPSLRIHQLIADSGVSIGIDLTMYKISEEKDYEIKKIEWLLKTTALDCNFFKYRNVYETNKDYSRECDYTICDYKCFNVNTIPNDLYVDMLNKNNLKLILNYFKLNSKSKITDVFTAFPTIPQIDIVGILWWLTTNNVPIRDKYNNHVYLSENKNELNLIAEPIYQDASMLNYYFQNLVTVVETKSSAILEREVYKTLPQKLELLFIKPQQIVDILSELPFPVQRIVLMGCLKAKQKNLTKNAKARDLIVNFYKGFILQTPDGIVTWLFDEPVLLDCKTHRWVTLTPLSKTHYQMHKAKFLNSPIGYYGLFHPFTRDFCVRDVTKIINPNDLRKITVGRRCNDWDQNMLFHIVTRLMKIKPTDNFMQNSNIKLLTTMIKSKPNFIAEDLENINSMKRFLFWSSDRFKRKDLCRAIEKWFRDNDLMEANFDCGHQRKTRTKFAQK